MVKKMIVVGTAEFYRLRGLTFPGMTDSTPDETSLYVAVSVVKSTILKHFKLWGVDENSCQYSFDDLTANDLEVLMEIVINIIIIFDSNRMQARWFKSEQKKLDGNSLETLVITRKLTDVLNFTRAALI